MLLSIIEIVILVVAVITNVLLGAIVLARNYRKALNVGVFCLSISLALWSIINYFSIHPVFFSQLTWARLVLGAASLQVGAIFFTFTLFPDRLFSQHKKLIVSSILYSLFVAICTQTHLVFTGLTINANGVSSPVVGPGIVLFMIEVVLYIGSSLYILTHRYILANTNLRQQIRPVIWGLVGTFGLIVFTNFVLVAVFKNTMLLRFGPAYTLIFFCTLTYSMLKHHLFDIRSAIARAVGYGFSLIAITVTSAIILFLVTSIFKSSDGSFTNVHRVVYILLSTFIAFNFHTVRMRFDRLSRYIFYRNGYDSQVLLDQFNDIIVSKFDIDSILSETEVLIKKILNVNHVTFVIVSDDDQNILYRSKFLKIDLDKYVDLLMKMMSTAKENAILLDEDELVESHNIHELARDVACVQRMSIDNRVRGLMLVGRKRGGNKLTSQDMTSIDLMSDELILAVLNALKVHQIESFNITLQEKVASATSELTRSNRKLQALDEAKDEFISMASHQLRTPLTSIKGYLSMVLEGDVGPVPDQQKEMLNTAFTSAQRMVYLISDLLNVSRLQTGKFVIEPVESYLPDVIDQELNQLRESIAAKNITLTYNKPDSFPNIKIDETKIRQVIMNFTDNALYYTPMGGSVHINLVETGKSIEFTVVDTGIGVPKADQHKLFAKFYRASNARKARPDGTGLGLFMAKKVIIASGGAIVFKTKEGKGSTFGFIFPKSKVL
jgi:signal transduction histidine kinase